MQPNFKLNSRKSQTLYALRLLPFIKLEAIFVLIESITIKIYFIRMISTYFPLDGIFLSLILECCVWRVRKTWRKDLLCYLLYTQHEKTVLVYCIHMIIYYFIDIAFERSSNWLIAKANVQNNKLNDDVHDAWLLDMELCTYFILWSYLAKQLYHGKGAQIKFIAHKRLRMMSKIHVPKWC